jgi:general secretion pathway protein G
MVTMLPEHRLRHAGFTLIELVVVMAIIALLVALAAPRYFHSIDRSKETVLKANLAQTRNALDKYYGDNGKYPDSLEMLVEKKYLRGLPYDPLTDSRTTWVIVPPKNSDTGNVYDLHSTAEGNASDGTAYASW